MDISANDSFWEKYGGALLEDEEDFPPFQLRRPSPSQVADNDAEESDGKLVIDEQCPEACDCGDGHCQPLHIKIEDSPASPDASPPPASPISPSLISGTVPYLYGDKVVKLRPRTSTQQLHYTEDGSKLSPAIVIEDNGDEAFSHEGRVVADDGKPSEKLINLADAQRLLLGEIEWVLKAQRLFEGHDTEYDSTGVFWGE